MAAWDERKHQPITAHGSPDGMNLAENSQSELNVIAHKLNTRPRKTRAYLTPIDEVAEPLR